MKISLRNKIIVSTSLVILVFGFLATISVFYYARAELINSKKDVLKSQTLDLASIIQKTLDQASVVSASIARQDTVITYLSRAEPVVQDQTMLTHISHYDLGDAFLAIYLMNNDGKVLLSTDESFVGNNYGFREYFKVASEGKSYVDVVRGVTSEQVGYYFSYPVVSFGEVIGVVVIKAKPAYVHSDILSYEAVGTGHVLMVNNYGIVLYSDKEDLLLKSLGQISQEDLKEIAVKKLFDGITFEPMQYGFIHESLDGFSELETFEFFDEEDGEKEIITLAQIGEYPFFVMLEEETDDFLGAAVRLAYILAFFIVLAAFLSGFMIFVLISRYLKPLDKFKKATSKIADGSYETRLSEEGGDEFSVLSKSFNLMLDKVLSSQSEVNKKVKQQTSEIGRRQQEAEDQQKAILNILEDVEEDKELAEDVVNDLEKFKLAVENASDHIVITDVEGNIVYANHAVEEITGYKQDEILKLKAGTKKNWGGQMDKKFYEEMWDTIKNKKQIFSGEIVNKRKDGRKYTALASVSPVLDKEGEVLFFVGIERDITKEKEIDKAKPEFVSIASHQLRTPLASINWYTEMLLDDEQKNLDDEQKTYLNEIYNGSTRMVRLVNDLLNVSRLDLGRMKIQPEKEDLIAFIEDVINDVTAILKEKNGKIIFKKPKGKMITMVDTVLFSQVVNNLISNAIKYSPKDKCVITVSLAKSKGGYEMTVADKGVGIPKHNQKKIFNKFFRADNAQKISAEGTGLGLYIAKMIMENSGGKLWFESRLNRGTTFFATIPLRGMHEKEGEKGFSELG